MKKGAWLTYAFDAPVTVSQPGLVYVAHRAEVPSAPVFAFDKQQVADCAPFAACPSALNVPTFSVAPKGAYYNGVSFAFPYHFLVRLYVEYTTETPPAARVFQKQANAPHAADMTSLAWGDIDNDGWDDLLPGSALYRNTEGAFVDVTTSSGLAARKTQATGGVFGE